MRVYMEKQHIGEYHGKYDGVHTVYRTSLKADMPAQKAIAAIRAFCKRAGLPDNLENGSLRIFRNCSNKQNFCYRFEVRTEEYLEILEYDVPVQEESNQSK